MDSNSLIRTAKTVDEAIELAILELDVDRAELEIDVISRGRAGILGIGAEPAKVRVRLITQDDGGAARAMDIVSNILRGMNVEARPTIRNQGSGPDDPPVIDIQGEDAGLLIGRRGENLRALQFIAGIILSRHDDKRANLIVDVEQYRERRVSYLQTTANRAAQRATSGGRPVILESMSPSDRRIIHMTLAENGNVKTQSTGEGNDRRIHVIPVAKTRAEGISEDQSDMNTASPTPRKRSRRTSAGSD